ncbi:hypothetical protein JRO89_XSUnG0049300 [Xanthoceras sorbifolium]|uniref:Protein CHUP1, chloroplastic n=1 Tax=Xanthoceras sorbifolium TaxID=99658 RepID=A0ABQ8GZY6_9ROSI|nr:hypothetical protein JRO89_XSUnG0049300 [Xanthoceras sorbifolium]
MKQHQETPSTTTTTSTKSESKPTSRSQSTPTPSLFRAHSRAKDSQKQLEEHAIAGGMSSVSLSPALKARPKPVSPDVKSSNITATRSRRSLVLNKPKSPEDSSSTGSQKADQVKVLARSRRQRTGITMEANSGKNENGVFDEKKKKKKELEEKLVLSDNLVRDLKSEVLSLKEELDKAQSLKTELEKQNKKLAEDLVAAEAKIAALSCREQKREPVGGEHKSPKFKDIQKLIANKLEHSIVRKEAITEASNIKSPPSGPTHSILKTAADVERKAPACPSVPGPPPPPPPPLRPLARAAATRKAPSFVQLYHSLTKQEVKRDHLSPVNRDRPAVFSAHSSIVGEIQNRSAHLLAIKADIETKGDFINSLIQKVLAAAYKDIEDVLKFVDWLDSELSSLADERAVLKHFNWPERKADAMREAAIEYRDLKLLESEISSYKDDTNIPCRAALKKMAGLLDKSEKSIQRLVKLRNSAMRSYQDSKIPVDWMLDSGIVSKIKQASMKLAQTYMKRVTTEIELDRNSDRESTQEALLLQGVHFAYRAHQFAGGLDSETLCAFEEIRQRVPGHLGGSRELLAAIPSS